MKPHQPLPPAPRFTSPTTDATLLAPTAAVLPLRCKPGQQARIEVLAGRLWLTRHGAPDDIFLESDQHLEVPGPATLYASAEGPGPARLRWVLSTPVRTGEGPPW